MARSIIRKPSFWKIVGAFRSMWKRFLRRMFIPWYGRKGVGWFRDPKKANYNWWYYRTSISIPRLLGYKPSRGVCVLALTVACFMSIFACPVDVVKAGIRVRRTSKSIRSNRHASEALRKNRAAVHNNSGQRSTTDVNHGSSTERVKTSVNLKQNTADARAERLQNNVKSSHALKASEKEKNQSSSVSSSRERLYDYAEVKPSENPVVTEPDENMPKTTPKNENDRYIRKRITVNETYRDRKLSDYLTQGRCLDVVFDSEDPKDRDIIMLCINGEKICGVPEEYHTAYATCLKLNYKVYAIVSDVVCCQEKISYELETWISCEK
ncbi:MAG: hypothetical protein IJW02_07225 [Clostridia bacterium]|nr:hypothetical protein [Clostridia bacterium]